MYNYMKLLQKTWTTDEITRFPEERDIKRQIKLIALSNRYMT